VQFSATPLLFGEHCREQLVEFFIFKISNDVRFQRSCCREGP
jgi:hypothetical protein